jgi:cytochrome c553
MKVLISVALALFLVGCSSDTKEEAKAVKQEVEVQKQESIAKPETPTVTESAKVEPTKDETVTTAEAVKEEAVAKIEVAKEAVVVKADEIKEAATSQASGAALYQVCAGCHGADASKPALGKSQIIKGWDADKISAALHGYKAGTYGGTMKSLMVGQVSKLSDDDIKTLSEHISKL